MKYCTFFPQYSSVCVETSKMLDFRILLYLMFYSRLLLFSSANHLCENHVN